MIHFNLSIEKSQFRTESCFGLSNACFQTSKTDPNGKGHAKTNLTLLQINSPHTNGSQNQVVVCCDNYSPLIDVLCEYFSIKIQ